MQPTEITVKDGRKLIVVEVPKAAYDIECNGAQITWPTGAVINFDRYYETQKIIGTLHYNNGEPVFDFDTEQFVEILGEIGKKGSNNYGALYMNHKYKKPVPVALTCSTKEESFLSLLHSYGIGYRENPLGEKPERVGFGSDEEYVNLEAWQKAEEDVLRPDKQYIFIEVKP